MTAYEEEKIASMIIKLIGKKITTNKNFETFLLTNIKNFFFFETFIKKKKSVSKSKTLKKLKYYTVNRLT